MNKQPGRGLRNQESLLVEVGRTDWPSRAIFFLAHSKMIKTPPFYAEIVHSEMGKDGRVRVYIEKPDAKDGFHRRIH